MREALERIVAIVDKRIRPRRWLGELEVMGEIAREALASEPESASVGEEPEILFRIDHTGSVEVDGVNHGWAAGPLVPLAQHPGEYVIVRLATHAKPTGG